MASKNAQASNGVELNGGAVQLPEQLRKQMAQVETLREDMNKPAEPVVPAVDDGQEPPAAEPPAAPPPAAAATPSAQEDQSWEQRYRSLEGRLRKEQETKQDLLDRLGNMENLIAQMQAAGAQPPAASSTEPPAPKKFVSAEEEQEYGAELLGVVAKKAREEISPEMEQLASRLKAIETRVDGVTTVTAKRGMQDVYDQLTSNVSNWKEINKSQEFKDWLSQNDPYAGKPRLGMLQEAFTRQDAVRVINFFKGFTSAATTPPGTSQAQAPSAPPASGSGRPSLEDFAAPGRARSAPAPTAVDKPIYTHAQIAKFMQDKLTGKWKGREADADAIEADIFQAQHEGRVSVS